MNNTLMLYEDRKEEVEFYLSIMHEMDVSDASVGAIDNRRFLRILKSNFLLMLYNLVEACVVSGMMEIYESLRNNHSSYLELIYEIRTIWSNNEIGRVYANAAERSSYEERVQSIINQVITSQPIVLSRDALGISGNLDARAIKRLCDKHRIRYIASDDDGYLQIVKEKRNNLAHGDESFGDCARDMTLSDLDNIKDAVCAFVKGIIDGMKEYYDNKLFLLTATT